MAVKMGCVVLAAGLSLRYGANKLLQELEGESVVHRILRRVKQGGFETVIAVVSDPAVREIAQSLRVHTVYNDAPEEGISRSIRLGLEQMPTVDACMFCVADQPFLSGHSIRKLRTGYAGGIVAAGFGHMRGNPVVFPQALFGELMTLHGDVGGGIVITRHLDLLTVIELDSNLELRDMDTPCDAVQMRRIKNLFVTGEKRVGKSTLIHRSLAAFAGRVGGFRTVPYAHDGVQGHALSDAAGRIQGFFPISQRTDQQHCIAISASFEQAGCDMLRSAADCDLVLMDELGRLERDAKQFQRCVFAALDAKAPVLGVLQQGEIDWMEPVFRRSDTCIIRVDEDSRAWAQQKIQQFLTGETR